MKYPFNQKKTNGKLIREFSANVNSEELVWHRDRNNRQIYISKGSGWKLQLENTLPTNLKEGSTYKIPKNTYHRILRGQTSLVVEISEDEDLMPKSISEIVAKGYRPVGFHEVSIFYGTASSSSVKPASDKEQDEFHRLLDIDEDMAYEYLNKWLEKQGLDRLDVY